MAGPNGSGKTTLFRAILGFLPVLGGSLIRNCALHEFGYVPQSAALDPTFPISAGEVVEMGAYGRLKPFQQTPAAERQRLGDVLEEVGLRHLASAVFFFIIRRAKAADSDRPRIDGAAENPHSRRASVRR